MYIVSFHFLSQLEQHKKWCSFKSQSLAWKDYHIELAFSIERPNFMIIGSLKSADYLTIPEIIEECFVDKLTPEKVFAIYPWRNRQIVEFSVSSPSLMREWFNRGLHGIPTQLIWRRAKLGIDSGSSWPRPNSRGLQSSFGKKTSRTECICAGLEPGANASALGWDPARIHLRWVAFCIFVAVCGFSFFLETAHRNIKLY